MAQGKIRGSNVTGPLRTYSTNSSAGRKMGRQGSITIAALTTLAAATYTIADSDAMVGDVIVVSPNVALEAGADIAAAWVSAEGTISIKIRNGSSVTLTGGAVAINYYICQ